MTIEKDILQSVRTAMSKAITDELVGYNKPLSQLVATVISDNSDELYGLINDNVQTLIRSDGFKDSLKSALNDKLAKVLISRFGGELERRVNELKSNPTTRAKITLAIESCIDELQPH